MAVTFNESSVWAEVLTPGVERQRLLTAARVPGTKILLDRVKLAPGASLELHAAAGDLAWFQMLEGEALLTRSGAKVALGRTHVVFLNAGFSGTLTAGTGAVFLYAQVPNAVRFDPDLTAEPPQFRIVDWAREPVLECACDARKRIEIVTPEVFGSRAIRGEIGICPPGTEVPHHHHEGAEHYIYMLDGDGTAHVGGKPVALRKGDFVHYGDSERHALGNGSETDMLYANYFVPGVYDTVRHDGIAPGSWTPTGCDIRGGKTAREAGRVPRPANATPLVV